MKFHLDYTQDAEEDLKRLAKSEPKAYAKALNLLSELADHPTFGTGKPERLKGNLAGRWSRRITDKHRLVYRIEDDVVIVLVLSAYGHYDDK